MRAAALASNDSGLPVEVTLVLRPRTPLPELHQQAEALFKPGRHLTHAEWNSRHAAHPDDIAILEAFARQHKFHITEVDRSRRTVQLSGTARRVADVFHPRLHPQQDGEGLRSHAPSQLVPIALREIVEAVLGLDTAGLNTAPVARRPKMRFQRPDHRPRSLGDLARAYAFPDGMDGSGQTIGLVELGGGFRLEDIEHYCAENDLAVPRISVVEVHGGANLPAHPHAIREMLDYVDGQHRPSAAALRSHEMEAAQATVEVTMDLEILAALAPGAHLVVYFATPDEQGIYHALSSAVHDVRHRPDVLSISWGEPEIALSDSYLHAIDRLLVTACHLGITVCASSGDAGARNNSPDDLPAVNFPASSPHCLACGGTTSRFTGERNHIQIEDEIVWNASHFGLKGATGGGVSRRFPLPAWQQTARVPLGPTGLAGRGVPDVAGPADPRYGCEIHIAGSTCSSAGTSAVAPLWAALVACCNQALGDRCGHLNPQIYHIGHHRLAALHPVTQGHNDVYEAGPGWNPCAGYGTPDGTRLIEHLQTLSPKYPAG